MSWLCAAALADPLLPQALNRAYGVLSDPKQRAVYDLLGEEGLKASWEVGQKHQTAEEVRLVHCWREKTGS